MVKLLTIAVFVKFVLSSLVFADPGKDEIGKLQVSLYFGANSPDVDAGPRSKKASELTAQRLRKNAKTKFRHYFELGSDTSSVLKTYENWATPMKPSEAVMLSFEPVGKPINKSIKLNLDLWQNKRKIMKSAATSLTVGKPLFIKGPRWRSGYLIIGVELKSLK